MPNDQYEEEALPFATIGTDEAKKMIEAGARVIDVRQPDEWVRGHIPEAELVPISGIYSFGKALKDLNLPRTKTSYLSVPVGSVAHPPQKLPWSQVSKMYIIWRMA